MAEFAFVRKSRSLSSLYKLRAKVWKRHRFQENRLMNNLSGWQRTACPTATKNVHKTEAHIRVSGKIQFCYLYHCHRGESLKTT